MESKDKIFQSQTLQELRANIREFEALCAENGGVPKKRQPAPKSKIEIDTEEVFFDSQDIFC